jgi:hypothetical protein
MSSLFKAVKKVTPWTSVRIETDGGKKRRTFRARKLTGLIKGVMADTAIVCSEKTNGQGRRYFACSNTRVTVGAILRAYKIRWQIELFHRMAKPQMGMCDAELSSFGALLMCTGCTAHGYCFTKSKLHTIRATDLLYLNDSAGCKNCAQQHILDEVQRIANARTQFGGLERQKKLIREILKKGVSNPLGEQGAKTRQA